MSSVLYWPGVHDECSRALVAFGFGFVLVLAFVLLDFPPVPRELTTRGPDVDRWPAEDQTDRECFGGRPGSKAGARLERVDVDGGKVVDGDVDVGEGLIATEEVDVGNISRVPVKFADGCRLGFVSKMGVCWNWREDERGL